MLRVNGVCDACFASDLRVHFEPFVCGRVDFFPDIFISLHETTWRAVRISSWFPPVVGAAFLYAGIVENDRVLIRGARSLSTR